MLDPKLVAKCLLSRRKDRGRKSLEREMRQLQAAVFVMCGGGMLGRSAAAQPGSFYVDDRVGKLPYSMTKVRKAVQVLVIYAGLLGYDPNDIPDESVGKSFFDCHNCDVF